MKIFVCIKRTYSGCGGPGYENDTIIKLTSVEEIKQSFLEENDSHIVQEFELDN